mgnify:CR=1 FL=1
MKSILLKSIVVLFLLASIPSLSEARSYTQQSTVPPFLLNTLSIMFNMSGKVKLRANIIDYASKYIGTPYRSGGIKPGGFDCSGFTSYLFRQYGISISRSSSAQAYGGTAVNGLANAQPGDVICYPGHVGLYVGGGQMIHANVPGGSVRLVGVNSIGMSVIAIRRYW